MAGTAEAVAEGLLARSGLAEPPATVFLAGDSGSSWGEVVIRRAAQLARTEDAHLLVVHVQISDGLAHPRRGRPGTRRGHRGCRAPPIPPRRARLRSLASRLRRLLPATAIEEVRKTVTGARHPSHLNRASLMA